MHKAGWNVAMSQRHDVGSTSMEVNKRPTSRHLNVMPSQCSDVATSRRQRDFSITIIKGKRDRNWRSSRYVRTRARKAEHQRRKSVEKTVTFVFFFFPERMMMFYRLNTCVLTFSMF